MGYSLFYIFRSKNFTLSDMKFTLSGHLLKSLRHYSYLLILLLVSCSEDTLFELMSPGTTGIDFTNEITETPENNIMSYQYMYNGAGVGLGDLNHDGFADIFLIGNSSESKLYLNKGNWKFEDVTGLAKLGERSGDWKTGVAMADINGDGWLDIYLCYSGNTENEGMTKPVQKERKERSNQLFINNTCKPGEVPTFTESAKEYGLDAIGTFSSQSYFLDYDRDGDLDMFLVNHANMFYAPFYNTTKLRKRRHPYFGNKLFRNENPGFTEVSEQAGIHGSGLNYGLSASIADFNRDNWPDIYVTNDYDEQDFLYLNQKDGTFTEVSHEAFGHISKFSMGSDVMDLNNDGFQDLFVADMLPEDNKRQKLLKGPDQFDKHQMAVDSGFHHQYMRNMLHINSGMSEDGIPRFYEIGQIAGVSKTDWSWATLFADLDNDCHQDLYITNGYLRDYTNMDFLNYAQDMAGKVVNNDTEGNKDIMKLIAKMPSTLLQNYCFQGKNGLHFRNASDEWGFDQKSISCGAGYADLDNDGDLDLVVNNLNQPAFVYQNKLDTSENRFIRIKLVGKAMNTYGIGSRIEIMLDTLVLHKEVYFSRGYQSSVEPVLTVGVGSTRSVREIRVHWPDSGVSVRKNVPSNTAIEIDQREAVNDQINQVKAEREEPVFRDVTHQSGIDFIHRENTYSDFAIQRLVPYQLSRLGGKMAIGDVNGDGNEDIFFGAAAGDTSVLYLNKGGGKFLKFNNQPWQYHSQYEDTGASFFDADGDADLDLYVVSGGSEFPSMHSLYHDRLYLNDGTGRFSYDEESLPGSEFTSGSCVVPCDYDHDGDMDLFVGGRIEAGLYPLSPRSLILKNESGSGEVKFTDVTGVLSKGVLMAGMVTDAVWSDINADSWPDLILVGEWMPVRFFLNDKGQTFNEVSGQLGLSESQGWWSRIVPSDLDADGDTDFILGNGGTNLQYSASLKQPMEYVVLDMNGDEVLDPILNFYIQDESYPSHSYNEMTDQVRSFRKNYQTYESYSQATSDDLIGKEKKQSYYLKINELRSSWLENKGQMAYEMHPLPSKVQVSMLNGFAQDDFDGNGSSETLCVGNFYPYRVEWGRSDSFYGAFLKFSNGKATVYKPEIPLLFDGDIRDIGMIRDKTGKRNLIISRNDGPVSVFEFQ